MEIIIKDNFFRDLNKVRECLKQMIILIKDSLRMIINMDKDLLILIQGKHFKDIFKTD